MKNKKISVRLQKYLPVIGLIVLIILFEILTSGQLFNKRTLNSLINESFTLILGTLAMSFLLSQGCLDFSVSGTIALAAACAARVANINIYLALPTALLVGAGVGLINGIFHGVIGIESFIATLAVSYLSGGLTLIVLNSGSLSIPIEMLDWDSRGLRLALIVAAAIVAYIIFEKTRIGKECKIVGSNPEFALQCGLSVKKIKIRGFVILGAVAGFLAFFAIIRSATASTSTGGGVMVNTLNALLIGGMPITGGENSKIRSAIIGSLIVAVLTIGMGLLGLTAIYQQLVTGLVFLYAIYMTFDRKNTLVIK